MEIVLLCFEIKSGNKRFNLGSFCVVEVGEGWEVVYDTDKGETGKTENGFVGSDSIRTERSKPEIGFCVEKEVG